MKPQRARYQVRTASLSEQFGQDLALKWFGKSLDDLIAQFGVYRSGKRKGLCRGSVAWLKVIEGGWCRSGFGGGFVLHPSRKAHALITDEQRKQLLYAPSQLSCLEDLARETAHQRAESQEETQQELREAGIDPEAEVAWVRDFVAKRLGINN